MITVAVSTFNRASILPRAVRSGLTFLAPLQGQGKVVLVDDASTDDSVTLIARDFAEAIAAGRLQIVRHNHNLGVTAAKNTAFLNAAPGWVIFLDSDDELLADQSARLAEVLAAAEGRALVMFRCIDESGHFVGRRFDTPQELPLQRFARHTSYGEVLLAIRKSESSEPPFDANLRGYEGLGCARLIERHGPALLSTVIARRYDRSRRDRLSRLPHMIQRAELIGRGHLRFAEICASKRLWRPWLALRLKAFAYLSVARLRSASWK